MGENLVLIAFTGAAVLSGYSVRLFFGRFRQHKIQTHRTARLLIGNLLMLSFFLSLAVLAGEIRFRFFYDTTDSFGLTKTTQRWFERHYHVNNWGFRDAMPYQGPIPDDQRRVTFLGDSFTAGHGVADVENRFVNRVRRSRPEWDVQMIADCGWDTGRQIEVLKDSQRANCELDLVVLVYCLNDIADIVPEWLRIADRIYEPPAFPFLVKNSYCFNTIYYRWKAARDPDVAQYYRFVTTHYDGDVWKAHQARLVQLQEHVHARGGQLLAVTFPFLHALDGSYPYREIHVRLDAFWEAHGVPHLDLLDVFAGRSSKELTVNARDAHPNERGHALAADAILEFLAEHRSE